jgi:hypothetical protein
MHMTCLKDMVLQMGKTNCPYCSCHVPAVRLLKFGSPGPFKRVCIVSEHWLIMLFLLPTFAANYRAAWNLNLKLMHIRLKFDNVMPLYNDIKEFRSLIVHQIIRWLPVVGFAVEILFLTATPFTWLNLAKFVLTLGAIFQ